MFDTAPSSTTHHHPLGSPLSPRTIAPSSHLPSVGPMDDPQALLAAFDEMAHGMLVLRGHRVLHANRVARHMLADRNAHSDNEDGAMPLRLDGAMLAAADLRDAQRLDEALSAARLRRLRKLIVLGNDGVRHGARLQRLSLTVVPLAVPPTALHRGTLFNNHEPLVLLVLGKHKPADDLAVYWYAKGLGLTQAEGAVLQGLCQGLNPHAIADKQNVAISTVRTQLAGIRAKTQTHCLLDVANEVACLPPLVHALTGAVRHEGHLESRHESCHETPLEG